MFLKWQLMHVHEKLGFHVHFHTLYSVQSILVMGIPAALSTAIEWIYIHVGRLFLIAVTKAPRIIIMPSVAFVITTL